MKIIAVLAATAASASAFAPATSGVRCTFLIDTILSYCRRMKKNPLRKGREGYHSAHGGATTMAILLSFVGLEIIPSTNQTKQSSLYPLRMGFLSVCS